eukprot:1234049-Prymnesium_polylepis.1
MVFGASTGSDRTRETRGGALPPCFISSPVLQPAPPVPSRLLHTRLNEPEHSLALSTVSCASADRGMRLGRAAGSTLGWEEEVRLREVFGFAAWRLRKW